VEFGPAEPGRVRRLGASGGGARAGGGGNDPVRPRHRAALPRGWAAEGGRLCHDTPAAVTDAALAGSDPAAVRTLACSAGCLAASPGHGADLPGARRCFPGRRDSTRILPMLQMGEFRRAFEAKTPHHRLMQSVPTWVITRDNPALAGLAHLPATRTLSLSRWRAGAGAVADRFPRASEPCPERPRHRPTPRAAGPASSASRKGGDRPDRACLRPCSSEPDRKATRTGPVRPASFRRPMSRYFCGPRQFQPWSTYVVMTLISSHWPPSGSWGILAKTGSGLSGLALYLEMPVSEKTSAPSAMCVDPVQRACALVGSGIGGRRAPLQPSTRRFDPSRT
jgi:hypothetical protein